MGEKIKKSHASGEVGEIRIEEHPYVMKGHKYIVYLRLPQKVDNEKLEWLVDDAFRQFPWQPKYVEVMNAKQKFPKDLEVLWKAIAKVDHVQIPPHKYLVLLCSDDPVDSLDDIEDNIAEELELEGILPPYRGRAYMTVRKVSLFPGERPKVVARIPITRKMVEQALRKMQKKRQERLISSKKEKSSHIN